MKVTQDDAQALVVVRPATGYYLAIAAFCLPFAWWVLEGLLHGRIEQVLFAGLPLLILLPVTLVIEAETARFDRVARVLIVERRSPISGYETRIPFSAFTALEIRARLSQSRGARVTIHELYMERGTADPIVFVSPTGSRPPVERLEARVRAVLDQDAEAATAAS